MIKNKIFPPEFESMANNPNVKLVMYGFGEGVNPMDCENCGGWGYILIFVAKKGPFRAPSSSLDENKIAEVNKWHNGKWWVGKNFTYPCPVCQGTGIKPGHKDDYKPLHTLAEMHKLERKFEMRKEQANENAER